MAPYRLDVVSLAPQAFAPIPELGVIGRAFGTGIAELHLHNPRDFATDRYRKVDDEPYGGGAGMVLKPEPVFAAVEAIPRRERSRVLLMSPQGRPCSRAIFSAGPVITISWCCSAATTKGLMNGSAPWRMRRCPPVILCLPAVSCRR